MDVGLVVLLVLVVVVLLFVLRSIRIVPQHAIDIVERLGRYNRKLEPGMSFVVPGMDQVRARIDLREQVLALRSMPFGTSDGFEAKFSVQIYHQVTDPIPATYEIENYPAAIEQLTMTVLRNVVGELELEHALSSYGRITDALQDVLTEATAPWGIRVDRVVVESVERSA